jgi:Helix-turn-helix domain
MAAPGFKFIDLPTSAERLGVSRTHLLQWVDEGRIRPFSGKGQQSVFRASDVERLAADLGREREEQAAQEAAASAEQATTTPARIRRRDPVRLIGTRLSQDSRWAEISDDDIATWADATEPVQYDRVRKVASITIERLNKVLASLDRRG